MNNKNYDIIFVFNGKELTRYDFENSFNGEAKETRELLAYENGVDVSDIKVFYQQRINFNIKLWRDFSMYGEYEKLDYANTLSILSDCLGCGNYATIKANGKIYHIEKSEHLKFFTEEFGAIELWKEKTLKA